MDMISVPAGGKKTKVEPPRKKRKKWPFQGYVDFQGLKIDLENKKGSVRKGKDPDGKPWSTFMHHHYGEIRGTEGVDGDLLDCYVGPNGDSPLVVVVHQQDPKTKKYDEDKVMLGFDDVGEACKAYRKQYNSRGYYQDHTTLNMGQFWRWVHDKRQKGKKVKEAEDSVVAPGLALGAGAGVGAGLRGYGTHKGLWEGINQELAGKMGGLADDAEKMYKSKVNKGFFRKMLAKKVFGPDGPPISKLRNVNLGSFPSGQFREAAIKGGLAVGVPTALGTMLALHMAKSKKKPQHAVKQASASQSTSKILRALGYDGLKYSDVIKKVERLRRRAAGASANFNTDLAVLQGGAGLAAGGLAAAGGAFAAPDTKYDVPAALAAGLPVGTAAALLSRKPIARGYLKYISSKLKPIGAQLGGHWDRLNNMRTARHHEELVARGHLARKLREAGDALGDAELERARLGKLFGAK